LSFRHFKLFVRNISLHFIQVWTLEEEDVHIHVLGKGKAVPLQAWSGPEGYRGYRKLSFPYYMTTAQDDW
jgi:hypothetical protein